MYVEFNNGMSEYMVYENKKLECWFVVCIKLCIVNISRYIKEGKNRVFFISDWFCIYIICNVVLIIYEVSKIYGIKLYFFKRRFG